MTREMAQAGPGAARSRRALLAGVGALAAAAGAGFAWWRLQPGDADAQALAQLWSLQAPTAQGGTLDFATLRGRPLLVNFWATWCPPCVEEMPLLDAFAREHAANGWQVVGITSERAEPVHKFLQRTPVAFTIALAGAAGAQLARALGNQTGGLPFTVVIGADGRIRQRRMGRVRAADLQAWSSPA